MTRRSFLSSAAATAMAQTPGKPNVVLVLMDNLGWGELGVYGGGILRGAPTPRLDRFAAEGLRLLNFNVEAQCTPSRAALLTGRYAVRTGNGSVPIESPRSRVSASPHSPDRLDRMVRTAPVWRSSRRVWRRPEGSMRATSSKASTTMQEA